MYHICASCNVPIISVVLYFHGSKLGVPIKTTVSATILEEALNGSVTVRPLQLGQPIYRKVNNQFIFSLAFASTMS